MPPFFLRAAYRHIQHRPFGWMINILMVTIGVGLLSFITLATRTLDLQMNENLRNVDMIVAAKGSPLQVLLSSIYLLDAPTGNIPIGRLDSLRIDPQVSSATPLSLGDSYQQFRIIGTDRTYFDRFALSLKEGKMFLSTGEVVIGSQVAIETGLRVGDRFRSNHGLNDQLESEHEHDLKVVGILKRSQMVPDQAILTPLSTYWDLHHSDSSQITSILIQFKTPAAMFHLPRKINQGTSEMAVLPAIEANKIRQFAGISTKWLALISLVILSFSGMNIFLVMIREIEGRLPVLAMMVAMGLGPLGRFLLILSEGLIIILFGWVLGILIAHGIFAFPDLFGIDEITPHWWGVQSQEAWLLLILIGLSLIIAFIAFRKFLRKEVVHFL
ncbi:MAG: ABC transporter permease [Bacteroidota bacterium]|nr:ABC transporter permease [Bacteroidota bacterium]MDX5506771.1 ABC transporter permease [Bacteroidota bacterium]